MSSSADLRIPVSQVTQRRASTNVYGQPWLFVMWMAAAAIVAVAAGTVLGLLAAIELSVGGERWTQSVQAHGRLQLFGFVATFVVALAFEFLPRLNQRPPFSPRVRLLVPGVLAIGSILAAAGQVWHEGMGYLAVPGSILLVIGSAVFAVLVWRVPQARPAAADPQPLFIRAAAVWLVIASALCAWSLAVADFGVVRLGDSRAVIETFLRGFVMLTIAGIALRAFVGHLGLKPLSLRRQIAVLAMLNASLVVWLAGQGLGALPRVESLVRVADIGYAVALLLFTAWFGVLRSFQPKRDAPAYALMIPVAWAGVALYAVLLGGMAIAAAPGEFSLYQYGAVRHVFLLGFMVPLMVGMAHIVLARFGTGELAWPRVLGLAFVLVTTAWPLRVLPALINDPPADAGKTVMAIAGTLLMAGLALVAAVCIRTAILITRREQVMAAVRTARAGGGRPYHAGSPGDR